MEALQRGDPPRIGDYELLARLGTGGMGVVYLGRSPGGRTVAVKVILERLAGDHEFRVRFRREVAAARTVTGTFTAPVLDADPEAAAPWLVTAYLPGLTLREAVRGFGPLPAPTLRVLAAGLAEALADIHRAGLAHRDLKPGNIMLTAGEPRVIDFGIARPEDATSITRVGDAVGTPGYMAPEQVAGQVAGPPADVFAYGAVLAYAATGRPPFGAGSTSTTLVRVRQVQADLGGVTERWLVELITGCLRADPASRPTAAALHDRLGTAAGPPATGWLPAALTEEIDRRAAQTRLPVTAGPATGPVRDSEPTIAPAATPDRVSRRQVIVAGVVAGAAGAVGLTKVLSPSSSVAGRSAPVRTPAVTTTTPAPPPMPVLKWKAKVSDYYPAVFTANGVVIARSEEHEIRALDPHTGKLKWKASASLLGEVTGGRVYVAQSANPRVTAIDPASGATRWAHTPAWTETPLRLVSDGSVVCYGADRIRALGASDGGNRWGAAVSVNGGAGIGGGVLAAVDKQLTGVDVRTGRTLWKYAVEDGLFPLVSGSAVYLCDSHAVLHAVRASNGKGLWQKQLPGYSLTLRTAGTSVYIASGDTVTAVSSATGEQLWSRTLGPGASSPFGEGLALSGSTLYTATTDRHLHAVSAVDGRELWKYPIDATQDSAPAIAGGLVFVGTKDGYVNALTPPAGS